jgi:hypothetical protein
MDPFVKHYQVLGLKEGCTETELEEAYQERSQAWNPENFSGNEKLRSNAQQKLDHITAAYEFLRPKVSTVAPPEVAEATLPLPPHQNPLPNAGTPPRSHTTLWLMIAVLALLLTGAALLLVWRTQW